MTELLLIHNPFGALRIEFLTMKPLNGHFSKVLFDTKIDLCAIILTNSLKVTLRSLSWS